MIVDRRSGSRLYPVISGERNDAAAAVCRSGLGAMSAVYRIGYNMRMKRLRGRPKDRLRAPVISVGNITLGGTGKTPVCRHLAGLLASRGMKVGIATRGYGREGAGTIILSCKDDAKSWHLCGDEPLLFLCGDPGTVVAVDADRARAGRSLVDGCGCDVVILDDGFQFITLERDADIVVIDAGNPFGFGKLFPAGLLREPISELKRAGFFWVTKMETVSEEKRTVLKKYLESDYSGIPIIESIYEPAGLFEPNGAAGAIGPSEISGARALCVSGIGNPESFEMMVQRITGTERIAYRFTDHHPFGDGDLSAVEDEAIRRGADIIITTEKDAVRLPGHFRPRCRWLVLRIGISIVSGAENLSAILDLICDSNTGNSVL